MASQKERGAIDGGFGRGVRVAKKRKEELDDEVELIDDDVNDFFDESESSIDRRRDPLRQPQ
jgi:hypothetical protein